MAHLLPCIACSLAPSRRERTHLPLVARLRPGHRAAAVTVGSRQRSAISNWPTGSGSGDTPSHESRCAYSSWRSSGTKASKISGGRLTPTIAGDALPRRPGVGD